MKFSRALLPLLAGLCFAQGHAQSPPTAAGPSPSAATLPNNPQPQLAGTVTGRVLYSDGQPVNQARVLLQPAAGPPLTTTTDPNGDFLFLHVPPGQFRIRADSESLAPVSVDGNLLPSGGVHLAPLVLRLAPVVTQINAISPEQAAEAQVEQEEHQRIGGIIPNFFVVYDDNAVPISPKQKFRLSARTLFDPSTIAVSAIIAGGEQAANSYPGFGHGVPGYFRRFGASYADGATGILLSSWVLPSLFHQDPRFFYKTHGTVRSRIGNVLRQAVEQKGDNGHWQFAWSNILGGMGSAAISTTYYPTQNRNWGSLMAENFSFGILSEGIANTLQQFVFNHITTHKDDPAPPPPAPPSR